MPQGLLLQLELACWLVVGHQLAWQLPLQLVLQLVQCADAVWLQVQVGI